MYTSFLADLFRMGYRLVLTVAFLLHLIVLSHARDGLIENNDTEIALAPRGISGSSSQTI